MEASFSGDAVVPRKSKKTLALVSLKRTFELFAGNHGQPIPPDLESQRIKIASKVSHEANAKPPKCY